MVRSNWIANVTVSGILASATEATWKVSTDDISNLKHGLVSIFNDSFTKQLLETIQVITCHVIEFRPDGFVPGSIGLGQRICRNYVKKNNTFDTICAS